MALEPLTKDRKKKYLSMSFVSAYYVNKIKYGGDIGYVKMPYEDRNNFDRSCARISYIVKRIELRGMDEEEGKEIINKLFNNLKWIINDYKRKYQDIDRIEERLYHKMFCQLNFPYVLLDKYRPGLKKVMNIMIKQIKNRRVVERIAAMKNNFVKEIEVIRNIESSKNVNLFNENDIIIAAGVLKLYDEGFIKIDKRYTTSYFARLLSNEFECEAENNNLRIIITKLLGFGFIKGKNKGGNMFFIGEEE